MAFALEILNDILKYTEGLREQPSTSLDVQLQAVIMNKSSELSASIQQLNTSHTALIQQLVSINSVNAERVSIQILLLPPVLLSLPPPPLATTGSLPLMALLCVCTVA